MRIIICTYTIQQICVTYVYCNQLQAAATTSVLQVRLAPNSLYTSVARSTVELVRGSRKTILPAIDGVCSMAMR